MRKLTTHCNRKHELTADNTYVVPKTGQKQCRKCRKIANDKVQGTIEYRKYQSDWTAKNRERQSRSVRKWELKNLYGLTPEQYFAVHKSQGGVCAICKKPETSVDSRRRKIRDLSIDHNHVTKENRGLLCHLCNNAIGLLKDNPAFCRAAADYLENPPFRKIILFEV